MEQSNSAEDSFASTSINLYAANGHLRVIQEDGKYTAEFSGISIRSLVDMIGQALLREERYANQLRTPFTVLQHTWMLTAYFFRMKAPSHIVAYSAIHDAAEAFVRDVPSPLKTPQAKAIEDAIFKAMPWADFRIDAYTAGFKEADGWASAVEAQVLGPWSNEIVSSRLPEDPEILDSMHEALAMTLRTPEQFILENWKGFVLTTCLNPGIVDRCGLHRPFTLK